VIQDKKATISRFLRHSETILYYVAAAALLITVGFFFVSTVIEIPKLLDQGAFYAAVTVLDRILFVFIFAELLHSIRVILDEDRILAEPFLLIGIIAVIRRILLVSAETQLSTSEADFQRFLTEMAVLAALVIALGVSFYLVRRVGRREEIHKEPDNGGRSPLT
jgi:uncharacterized membrane protein (DUF373 family)